jgi:hypothetical protein
VHSSRAIARKITSEAANGEDEGDEGKMEIEGIVVTRERGVKRKSRLRERECGRCPHAASVRMRTSSGTAEDSRRRQTEREDEDALDVRRWTLEAC